MSTIPASASFSSSPNMAEISPAPKASYNKFFHQMLTEIMKKLAEQTPNQGLSYTTAPNDTWMGVLQYKKVIKPVIGFDIGINSSATRAYCDDKPGSSFLFNLQGIPHISHQLFRGNTAEERALKFAKEHQFSVVCKPKDGTCGEGVHRIRPGNNAIQEMAAITHRLIEKNGDICVCPYVEIKHEYRLIMLAGKAELIFEKNRAQTKGNGVDTLRQLIQKEPDADKLLAQWDSVSLDEIPADGEVVCVNWKHNLCTGAVARLVEPSENEKVKQLVQLAQKTVEALGNAEFISVDIVEAKDQSLQVLEVNNGIMMEFILKQHPAIYDRVKAIFEKAVCKLLSYSHSNSAVHDLQLRAIQELLLQPNNLEESNLAC